MKKNSDYAGLMVPAGLSIGMGVGFIRNNIPAWLFIGLGAGFGLMALIKILKK